MRWLPLFLLHGPRFCVAPRGFFKASTSRFQAWIVGTAALHSFSTAARIASPVPSTAAVPMMMFASVTSASKHTSPFGSGEALNRLPAQASGALPGGSTLRKPWNGLKKPKSFYIFKILRYLLTVPARDDCPPARRQPVEAEGAKRPKRFPVGKSWGTRSVLAASPWEIHGHLCRRGWWKSAGMEPQSLEVF